MEWGRTHWPPLGAWGSVHLLLGFSGLDVDAFYRLQAWFFGSDNHWQTIVKKVLVDQFVYCILWASPVTAFFYEWKEADFSLSQWRRQWNSSDLLDKIIVFMVSTWIVWIPATAIVYSLPLPLQIPLFNLTLCFFVLLVSVFLEKKRESLKTSGRGSVGRERSGHHCRGWHPLFPPVCFWPNESFVREESAVNISPPEHEDS